MEMPFQGRPGRMSPRAYGEENKLTEVHVDLLPGLGAGGQRGLGAIQVLPTPRFTECLSGLPAVTTPRLPVPPPPSLNFLQKKLPVFPSYNLR